MAANGNRSFLCGPIVLAGFAAMVLAAPRAWSQPARTSNESDQIAVISGARPVTMPVLLERVKRQFSARLAATPSPDQVALDGISPADMLLGSSSAPGEFNEFISDARPAPNAVAAGCPDCGCRLWGDLSPRCTECPARGGYALLGYEAFRGHPDGGWGNNGLHTGVNYATRLGRFSDWTGIGMQIGGTMGVFDWSGTDYRFSNRDQASTQGFVTYGLFRKANAHSRWSAAVVHDWMINHTFSVFGEDPTLFQWRGQLGYAFSAWNEFGVWGTWRGRGDTRQIPVFGSTTWRPIRQLNFYWHHKWEEGGADTWLWVGVPERERLAGDGSLGDYLAGALANCPLNDCVSLYSLVTYMHPSATPGPAAAREEGWSFSIGLSFFPGRRARTSTVAGRCWMPQLPVASNGYFLVDASQTY